MSLSVKKKKLELIGFVVLFIILSFFFIVCHPMYLYDSDDWTYASYSRQFFPTISEWNPTKVLPETFMPLISEVGVWFIYPFINDYICALSISYGITIALLITLYFWLCYRYTKLYNGYGLDCGIVIYILLHFLLFIKGEVNNRFFFYGGNVNCYFNYIVPGLFNFVIVLFIIQSDNYLSNFNIKSNDSKGQSKVGIIICWVYLCIFSNLFHSIVLASYVFYELLVSLVKYWKHKKGGIKKLLKENFVRIAILLLWFVCIITESVGARAQLAAETTIYNLPIIETFNLLVISVKSLNPVYIFFVCVVNLLAFGTYLFNLLLENVSCSLYKKNLIGFVFSWLITVIYLILLCAKVQPNYIQNNTVMISWLFWLMLITLNSITYLSATISKIKISFPIIICILFFNTVINGKMFAPNNVVWNYSIDTVKDLDECYISQIIEADNSGLEEVFIKVPVTTDQKWPLDVNYAGDRIATTLYRHGVIKRNIHVSLIQDATINQAFNVNAKTMP